MNNLLKRIVEYGLYLFIFLLPWQTRWIWQPGYLAGGPWEYGTFSLYGVDILLILLIILSFFIKGREAKAIKNIWILILAFLFISFLSIFGASNQELGWYAFIRLLEGAAIFWLVWRSQFSLVKAGVAFASAGFIQSGFAIYQFFSQSSPAFKWLGLASQDPGVLGDFVVGTNTGRFLRAYGSLPHPNMLGGFLVMAIIILLGLYFYLNHSQSSRWFLLKDLLIIISLVVITFGLLLTFSRSAWLALAVALAILFLVNIFRKRKLQVWLLAKATIVMLLVAVMTFVMIPELFETRALGQVRLEIKSTQERIAYYSDAKKLIEKNWLKGVGVGNYTQAVYNQIDSFRESWDYQPVHNIYLLVGTETGIFGLIVFLLLLFEIIKNIIFKISRSGDWFLVNSSILIAFLVIGFFDHYFWTLSFGIWLFWLALGIQIKADKEV